MGLSTTSNRQNIVENIQATPAMRTTFITILSMLLYSYIHTSMAKIICGIHWRIGFKVKLSSVNDVAGFLIFNLSYRVHLLCCQETKLKTSFVYLINSQEIQFRSTCRQKKLEVQILVRLI